jgi:hypothetical protein
MRRATRVHETDVAGFSGHRHLVFLERTLLFRIQEARERRVIDPAKRRPLRAVLPAHVEARAPIHGGLAEGRVVDTALLYPFVDAFLKPAQLCRGHCVLSHQVAIPPEPVYLLMAQHELQGRAALGLMSIQSIPSLRMMRATFFRIPGR